MCYILKVEEEVHFTGLGVVDEREADGVVREDVACVSVVRLQVLHRRSQFV